MLARCRCLAVATLGLAGGAGALSLSSTPTTPRRASVSISSGLFGRRTTSVAFGSSTGREGGVNQLEVQRAAAKDELYAAIDNFNTVRSQPGSQPSIDFGVSGGELDKDTRAPSVVSFYKISPELGDAGEAVFNKIKALEALGNPTPDATKFLGTEEGRLCPLNGGWKLAFTTAADATFSANSTRGEAAISNVVDAVKGTVTNVIDFAPDTATGKMPVVEQLRVLIKPTALSPTRVGLRFLCAKARLRKLFGIPLPGGRRWRLTFPVPGPFLTKIIFTILRKPTPPMPYFEVAFLDDDLRIHRTGEGNTFVQRRPSATANAWA